MNVRASRRRAAAVVTAVALGIAPLAAVAGSAAANAAPIRTASTSTDTTYLQDTLGVAADTRIETVTYDRFQYLLQQPGKYAVLIGDPAEDANFAAEAQGADAAAKAAGVAKVYWFDPNLSGSVVVNGAAEPNLDIRNPAGITTLNATSQGIYDRAWLNLVGQYLGNGVTAIPASVGTESQTVGGAVNAQTGALTAPIGTQTSTVNDANAPLYDYRTATPTNVTDSTFFVYDKDATTGSPAQADKLVQSVDFTPLVAADTTPAAVTTDATTAVATALAGSGSSAFATTTQFDFWHSEVNSKELAQNKAGNQAGPIDDSDNAQPWAIDQITFPELVHLLNQKSPTGNFAVFFGGTWCPNTRAVIKDVNKQAQLNNVTVYNFDTVLDGGTVGGAGPNGSNIAGGGTTGSGDALQTRNSANNGVGPANANANPTFIYGSLLSTYFKNIATQYEPDNGSYVTYYPNGDSTQPIKVVRKLQVPFLLNYQHGNAANAPSNAIKRQWIQQNLDPSTGLASFTEYMTEFYYTHPDADRLGLSVVASPTVNNPGYPLDLPIPGIPASGSDAPVYADTDTFADAATFLSPTATDATTTPAGLAAALAAVPGSGAFATVADVTAALTAANAATPVDTALVANLTTIKNDWSIALNRKNSLNSALANIPFAQEAIAKLGTFFGGLPGGVVSTQTVAAPAVAYGSAPHVNITIANDYGRIPVGDVTLTIGGASYTAAVSQNSASFALPKLAPGAYQYTLSYPGDDQIVAFTKAGSLTVGKGGASGLSGAVVKAPTTTKAGSYRVTVATPSGLAAATGKVTVTLKNGKTSKALAGTLAKGAATVAVPKLTAGSWTVALSWAGDADYAKASATAKALTVAKSKVSKVAGTATTKPTTKKAGKFKVTVTVPAGLVKATGKVTVKLTKKGSATKTVAGTLKSGTVTVSVPKLAKGTWVATITWAGDANYLKASGKGSIKVVK